MGSENLGDTRRNFASRLLSKMMNERSKGGAKETMPELKMSMMAESLADRPAEINKDESALALKV